MKNKIVFLGESPVPYVRSGGSGSSVWKAVLHTKDKIKPYRRLKDLKKENPDFKNLSRAYVKLQDGIIIPIMIRQSDAKRGEI